MREMRQMFCQKLHKTYSVRAFDNTDVWAGNLSVELDGITYDTTMARAFVAQGQTIPARMRVEVYAAQTWTHACGPMWMIEDMKIKRGCFETPLDTMCPCIW
jgi:hypothetical protein